jgi:phage tail sheath protein FI
VTLQPVDTATAAFVGEHPSGPRERPLLIRNARELGPARCHLTAAAEQFFAHGGTRLYVLPGDDFAGLDHLDDISLVASPGHAAIAAGAAYCERRRDCFFVADAPAGAGPDEVRSLIEGVRSSYAALYVPWLDPETPASGAVAGVLASAPVWHRPETGAPPDVDGVNVVRRSRTGRIELGSSQTLDPEWKYVSIRRTAIYLERSIDKGTQWAVFEPNEEPLWARLRSTIGDFLAAQWREGAFQGQDADEAYFVTCDRTTMTQNDIDAGIVNVVVGFAPLRPAEFVVIRIGLWAARDDPDP